MSSRVFLLMLVASLGSAKENRGEARGESEGKTKRSQLESLATGLSLYKGWLCLFEGVILLVDKVHSLHSPHSSYES